MRRVLGETFQIKPDLLGFRCTAVLLDHAPCALKFVKLTNGFDKIGGQSLRVLSVSLTRPTGVLNSAAVPFGPCRTIEITAFAVASP